MTLYLDSAAKQITLGRIPKKTLSRFYKENRGGSGTGSAEEDDIMPEGYDIIDDPGTGEPTLIKVPVMMQIMTLPYKDGSASNSTYEYGDTLDFNGLTAKLVAKGQTQHGNEEMVYFTDSHYDEDIPFNELSFDPTTYNKHAGKIMVWCTWTNPYGYYNGIKFKRAFYMHSLTEAAAEEDNMPVRIEVIQSGLDYYTLRDGQRINTSGLIVKAYMEDDSEYNAGGYDGRIPITELEIIPKTASLDSITSYTGKVTGPSTDGITIPFSYGSISGYEYFESDNPYIDGGRYNNVMVVGDDVRACSWLWNEGRTYAFVLASEQPFQFGIKSSSNRNGPSSENIALSNVQQTTYNNHTYYYTSYSISLAQGMKFIKTLSIPVNSGSPEYYPTNAYLMLFGETEMTEGKQTISVNWKRPDGVTLTTTFQIKVSEEGGEGGANR